MPITANSPLLQIWALPMLAGSLSVLGFAPYYLFPIPVLALAYLVHQVQNDTPLTALRRGFAFGFGWFLAGVSWVYVSMHDVGGMPAPVAGLAVLLFAAYLGLFPALACQLSALLSTRWRAGTDLRLLVILPALWTLTEWLRGWLFTGFPWQAAGYSQAPWSPLAGYAPLLGVYGVSGLMALSAAALVRRSRLSLSLLIAVWLGGWAIQHLPWTHPEGAPLRVSLLQGNIPQSLKFRPEQLSDTLIAYQELAHSSTAPLIVLPETAIPLFLDTVPPDYLSDLAGHALRNGGDLLLGVADREDATRYYNSMVSLGTAPSQRYRKTHLVPFGEFIPPGFKWFLDLMQIPLGDFSRGPEAQPPMHVANQRVAINICYEDVFGEELIHALPAATLMANVSNDAWFGHSFAPWQHLQISQMRALETGRWWVRANNTGITAIINADGHVVSSLAPFTRGALHGSVQGHRGLTPYARWGNSAALGIAIVGLLLAWHLRKSDQP